MEQYICQLLYSSNSNKITTPNNYIVHLLTTYPQLLITTYSAKLNQLTQNLPTILPTLAFSPNLVTLAFSPNLVTLAFSPNLVTLAFSPNLAEVAHPLGHIRPLHRYLLLACIVVWSVWQVGKNYSPQFKFCTFSNFPQICIV